eukprot:54553_1
MSDQPNQQESALYVDVDMDDIELCVAESNNSNQMSLSKSEGDYNTQPAAVWFPKINITQNTNYNSITFKKDLSHFYMAYGLQYSINNITPTSIILLIIALIVILFQFTCLIAFIYVFVYSYYGKQTLLDNYNPHIANIKSSAEYYYDKNIFNGFSGFIVVAISVILLCYLVHYSHSFIASLWVYLSNQKIQNTCIFHQKK